MLHSIRWDLNYFFCKIEICFVDIKYCAVETCVLLRCCYVRFICHVAVANNDYLHVGLFAISYCDLSLLLWSVVSCNAMQLISVADVYTVKQLALFDNLIVIFICWNVILLFKFLLFCDCQLAVTGRELLFETVGTSEWITWIWMDYIDCTLDVPICWHLILFVQLLLVWLMEVRSSAVSCCVFPVSVS